MPNENGNAYALTVLCPLLPGSGRDESPSAITRNFLNNTRTDEQSPMAKVPNTYFCRFFVLDDVLYERKPAKLEHLKSDYLVFECNLHGALEPYLMGLWEHAGDFVRELFKYGVAFDGVRNSRDFVGYVRKCQVETTFYFNGSTDESPAEQLKALYLTQEFSKFAFAHQGSAAAELQRDFRAFIAQVKPFELFPTWRPGASSLETAIVGGA